MGDPTSTLSEEDHPVDLVRDRPGRGPDWQNTEWSRRVDVVMPGIFRGREHSWSPHPALVDTAADAQHFNIDATPNAWSDLCG